ncbi:MAG: tRNA (adenosine(37)-N6)-dimethylallyltransferase MiaA [Peptoniphilaceae bacterium]
MQNLLILTGPTGVGKSDLSIKVANKYKLEIISADSMQIYKNMDIGTAKIDLEATDIKHHMIDIINPDEDFSVADFQKSAKNIIYSLNQENKLPFIVGGTGLYINSLLYNWSFQNTSKDIEYRSYLEKLVETKGIEHLYNILLEKDRESAEKIDSKNKNRIIRALEINKLSGKKDNSNLYSENKDYNLLYLALNLDREKLYQKINNRVDKMIELGLLKEVKELMDKYDYKNLNSFKAIGYKEIISYYNKEISLKESIDLIKKNSRHYAKRQITWFKRDKRIIWLDKEDKDIEEKILKLVGDKFEGI